MECDERSLAARRLSPRPRPGGRAQPAANGVTAPNNALFIAGAAAPAGANSAGLPQSAANCSEWLLSDDNATVHTVPNPVYGTAPSDTPIAGNWDGQ